MKGYVMDNQLQIWSRPRAIDNIDQDPLKQ